MAKTVAEHMEIGLFNICTEILVPKISRPYKKFSATKMWQHERNDWDQATCVDSTCSFANNCAPNAQFGCGHFTQNVWKGTTHVCYQVGFRRSSSSYKHGSPQASETMNKAFTNFMNSKSIRKDSIIENTLLLDTAHQVTSVQHIIPTSKPTHVLLRILACQLTILKSEITAAGNKTLLTNTKAFY